MKKRLLAVTAVLLLAVALTGCAGLGIGGGGAPTPSATSAAVPSPSKTPEAPPSPSAEATAPAEPSAPNESPAAEQAGIVSINAIEYEYKSQYIETHIVLPLISGLDGEAGDKINAVFSDMMSSLKESSTAAEAESKQMTDDGYPAPGPYMLVVSYSVPYNTSGVLSIVVSTYTYLGGAHGGETWLPFTFDASTGRELTLADLMQNGSGYREYINGVIRQEIDKMTASEELAEIATFEDIGDEPWFYLTPEGLVFYFQQYEYFPYAAGIQQFDIPYGDVAAMLLQKYAALEMRPIAMQPGESSLKIGGIGQAALDGNASTGYSWKYEIKNEKILELCNQDFTTDAADGVVGAGGQYTWNFRAKRPGTTTIIFTYSRDWETDVEADQTVEYTVTVK
jgi:inhibitor of cysteine peptidase